MRRVLLDENLPRKLRRDLNDFSVRTVQEENWTSFGNGGFSAVLSNNSTSF